MSASSDIITLSVGGKIYKVAKSTFDKYPDTMLSRMVSDDWKTSKTIDVSTDVDDDTDESDVCKRAAANEAIFIDRDSELFEYILNWYRNGEICIPWNVSEEAVRREASYFALPDDVRVVRDTILINVREAVSLVLDDVREKIAKCQSDQERVNNRYVDRLAQIREEKRMLKAQCDAEQKRIRRDAMTFEILLPILTQTAAVISPMVAVTSQQISQQTVRDIRSSTRDELAELGDVLLETLASYGVPAKSIRLCPTFMVTEYSRCNICGPPMTSAGDTFSRLLLFLEVNGLSPLQTPGKEMLDAAEKIGAGMIVLEQRYTGMSLPTKEFSVTTLKELCKVPQSVKDAVLFGEEMKERLPGVRIILFGCSHGGMIAALARKYSTEIFDGAIVSSAPLKLQLEYKQYAEILGEDFSNKKLGGSDQCLRVLRDAHIDIGGKLGSPEGRELLVEKFGLCHGDLEEQQLQESFTINGRTTGVNLLYNDPKCRKDYCNIQRICARLTTRKEPPLDALADIYKTNRPSGRCLAKTVWSAIARYKNDKNCGGRRINVFDTCASTGLLPTCSHIRERIEELRAYVGDFRSTTNILSINGNADPWYPSSIHEEGEGPEVELVQGASHYYWYHVKDE
ncbi:potassium channel tetramerization domain containing [Perkinsus chesapeaki]|uniref:Potassium channel tetramerization domain containing n=1 Tax=Perkinsus chesapeaki TaxID=330153 RepID=A0A7J6MFK5_PERCH|nr:potassium channel tetramerization domain containing [Perkinsus chesapeaki]